MAWFPHRTRCRRRRLLGQMFPRKRYLSSPCPTPRQQGKASQIPSHKTAAPLEEIANKTLPLVLDKDGYLFECLLADGVMILENRASDNSGLRDRPKLLPSGLLQAW